MRESKDQNCEAQSCESCEEMFESNIESIVNDATPPTMDQHMEKQSEVRDIFIEECETQSEEK